MRKRQSLRSIIGILAALITALFTGDATAYTARVVWAPVVGATGYTIYVGQDANPYGTGVNVGARTPDPDGRVRYDLTGLNTDVTSHFVVVSYGEAGMESDYSNERQLAYAAIAAVVDSDGDGVKDGAEDRNLNRLVDATETNRHDADTDNDGFSDGAEIAAGTNPLDPNDPGTAHPTVAPTPTPTPARTATPIPAATATPVTATCGNQQREGAEQCDGADAANCDAPCLADCTCAVSFHFPLEGWTADNDLGTQSVQANDPESGGPVLITATDRGTKFSIVYPARQTLSVPLPLLSLTVGADNVATVALTVRATNGREYVLAYRSVDGVPTTLRRTATFPIGAAAGSPALQTTIRDLAADLQTAFGVGFAAVEQAEVAGPMRVAALTLFAAGGLEVPVPAQELALPLAGWSKRGAGTIMQNEYDPALDAPTLSAVPANADRPRIAAGFPEKRDIMAAAFRTLSLAVDTDGKFAVEVRVRLARGVAVLVYEPGITSVEARGSRLTLPLELVPIAGSAYQLVTLDLGADVRRGLPDADFRGILSVRMRGQFRVGDIVLQDPIG